MINSPLDKGATLYLVLFLLHIRNNASAPLKVNTPVMVIGNNNITFGGGRSAVAVGQCDATRFEGSPNGFDVRISIKSKTFGLFTPFGAGTIDERSTKWTDACSLYK